MIDNLSKRTMARNKEMNVSEMLSVSKELFFTHGIENVTIRDIANELKIGEATIYRYFKKKQYVVIAVTMDIWKTVDESYISPLKGNDAFEYLSSFYHIFLDVYKEHKEFYSFVASLDSFLMTEKLDEGILSSYEKIFMDIQSSYMKIVQQGKIDGSIKKDLDYSAFYNMSTHAVLSLCKKLSLGKILNSDQIENAVNEISMIIDVLLTYIKP